VTGQSIRWTLIECNRAITALEKVELEAAYSGGRYSSVPDVSFEPYISADEVDPAALYSDGAVIRVTVNAYERNPRARRYCIAFFGARCFVCGFDFGSTYGSIAAGHIHVHHLRPLADIGSQYEVNPVKDMRPICPNCHAVVHRRTPPYSMDEVRAMLIPHNS